MALCPVVANLSGITVSSNERRVGTNITASCSGGQRFRDGYIVKNVSCTEYGEWDQYLSDCAGNDD